ncbi:AN1-type zinc finger protein 5-like [Grus japonensis]|uniref:AN1-type zinc finger protein 5-like n=1 Tax=Grus japonensis TaxID=30415 RepID=A0ABC9VYP2_GRUJA
MPAGSKMDLLLAKAKPISNGGSTSGITELRRGETAVQQQLQPERGVEEVRGTTLQTPRSVKKEGRRLLQAPEQRSPCSPLVKTMVRQAVPLQPMEDDGGADIHLQPVENPTPEQVDAPEGGCDPVGSPRWSRLLAGPVAL